MSLKMHNTRRKCAKCGKTRAQDLTVTYHRFPAPGITNTLKAHAWAKYCWPDKDWTKESLHKLYIKNKVLCGRHFRSSQFYDNKRQKLSIFAVPDSDEVIELLNSRENIYNNQEPEVVTSKESPLVQFSTSEAITASSPSEGITLHSFPHPSRFPEQFQVWVGLVNELVQGLTPSQIYSRKKVCDLHFTPDDRNRNNRLNAIAIPVPFPYQKGPRSGRTAASISDTNHGFNEGSNNECVPTHEQSERTSPQNETTHEDVSVPNLYSWEQYSQEVPDDLDVVSVDMSMYCEDNDPASRLDEVMDKDDSTAHEGFWCNVCKKIITGFRYTCVQCNDFDLCEACERDRQHQHHYVLRVPAPRPMTEVQSVLAAIRRYLMNKLDPITDPDQNLEVMSIKSEIKSEDDDDDDDDEKQKQTSGHESDSSDTSAATDQSDDEDMDCSIVDKSHVNESSAREQRIVSTDEIQTARDYSDDESDSSHGHKPQTNRRKMLIKSRAQDSESENECNSVQRHALAVDNIPTDTMNTEVQSVLAAIRRYLMNKLDPITDPDQNLEVMSIKSEIKSEDDDDDENQKQTSGHESDSSDTSAATDQSDDEDMDCSIDKSHVNESSAREQRIVSTDEIQTALEHTDDESDSSHGHKIQTNRRKMLIKSRAQDSESENECDSVQRHALAVDNIPTDTMTSDDNEAIIYLKEDAGEGKIKSRVAHQHLHSADNRHYRDKASTNRKKKIIILRQEAQESKGKCLSTDMHGLSTKTRHSRDKPSTNRRKMIIVPRQEAQESKSKSLSTVMHGLSTKTRHSRDKPSTNRRKMIIVPRQEAQESESECHSAEQYALNTTIQQSSTNKGKIIQREVPQEIENDCLIVEQDTLSREEIPSSSTAKRKTSAEVMNNSISVQDKATSDKKICIRPIPGSTVVGFVPKLLTTNTGLKNPYIKLKILKLPPGAIVKPVSKALLRPPLNVKDHNTKDS